MELVDLRRHLLAQFPDAFALSHAQAFKSLIRDIVVLFLLWQARYFLPSHPILWALVYIVWVGATGFSMWCLFVLGHDCSHGVFSSDNLINDIVGHVCHAPLLVPFWPWAKSHRLHHLHTNNVEQDHSWRPITRKWFEKLSPFVKKMRFTNWLLLSWPLYLLDESPLGSGNHFWPGSRLFSNTKERLQCIISDLSIILFLIILGQTYSLHDILLYYGAPWVVFSMWLAGVTYLHHTSKEVTYYHDSDWTFLQGALGTVDRSYGKWIEPLHHWIGSCHLVHHLFFNRLPHYHLKRVSEIVKSHLQLPLVDDKNVWQGFVESRDSCHIVANEGPVKYQQA